MKQGPYTTTLEIELEFFKPDGDNYYKEFEVEFTSHWVNDGLGWIDAWGHRSFDKGNSYFEQLDDWKILSDVTKQEKAAIEDYIDKNEDEILQQMVDSYDPYWDHPY